MAYSELCLMPSKISSAIHGNKLLEPLVLNGFINHWTSRSWSPETLSSDEALSEQKIIFRVAEIHSEPIEKRARPGSMTLCLSTNTMCL